METIPIDSTLAGDSRLKKTRSDFAGTRTFRSGGASIARRNFIASAAGSGKTLLLKILSDSAGPVVGWAGSADAGSADNDSHRYIEDFPGEPYVLRHPIPISIKQLEKDDFEAIFEEANIAASGASRKEAFQNLAIETLNIFEIFSAAESNLGPEPARQLRILRSYLARI